MTEGHFHVDVRLGSRDNGDSAAEWHDYLTRRGQFAKKHDGPLVFMESGNMPTWAADDPRKFWEAADIYERANGALYHTIEFALPLALTHEQQLAAAREKVAQLVGDKHPYTFTIHGNVGNPHFDVMFTGRTLDGIERGPELFFKRANKKNTERGGCLKVSIAERGPEWVVQVRQDWEQVANRHLTAAGSDVRIDHRSYKDRGIDKAPGVHLGPRAHRLEKRGKATWRGIKNREAQRLNTSLQEVQSQINRKENSNGKQRPGRPGKPHSKQQHRAGVGGTAAAPKRAFSAWRIDDRGSDRPGLRTSKHLGPQPLQTLRVPRPGQGQQEHGDSLLLRPLQGHRRWGGDLRLHSLSTRRGKHMTTPITLPPSAATAGLDCGEHPERRQEYKKMLLSDHYHAAISQALADQLLYVDRRKDHTMLITLRDEEGNVGGQVHDQGDKMLALSHEVNDAEIMAMLELARAKGWFNVTPTGSPEFCKRAAELADAAGFGVDKAAPQNALTQSAPSAPASGSGDGATTVTPDASSATAEPARQPSAAETRWADALLSARTRLMDEHKAAQVRLQEIPQVDIAKLESDLATKHGGDEYKTAVSDYKAAVAAAKDATIFTRSRAEDRKEATRRRLMVARDKALAVPAAAACIKKAREHNQERTQIEERLVPIKVGVGELDFHLGELRRGVDPEERFAEAWRRRKAQPLKLWQEHAISPVFTADAQREQARQQAESKATEAQAAQARQEQAQREISAQQRADDLLPLLNQPGRSAEQEEALQQEHRFYTALAQGYDEAESRERADRVHPTDVARP